ncbi:VWA domain-containing protein [Paenibacillus sp. CC-CFT742]|nr:VWA domain-containing protein [Paenibacillus sp. CC-CFT742]WJH27489.1 VWA domain-containing protein [Paenibacillus sp. CC-CFT742]
MSRVKKMLVITLIFLLGISSYPFSSQAATSYVSATKTANPSSILVGGETEVTLNIKGSPPVNVVKPNDVILVIDKSGSMGQEKMNNAKAAAKGFIDLMDLSKHQVGIVDYQSSPSSGVALTSDAKAVKSYIDTIFAGGGTGTASAIDKARELLESHRPEAQPVIVLLTDGDATEAGDGLSAYDYTLKKAEEAKNAGIVFYTIALLDQGTNPDTSGPNKLMKDMATTSHHHHFVLGSTGLSDIYAAIVQEIGLASAYDVVVTDIVPENFEIVPDSYNNNIPKPNVSGNTLMWNFLELKKDTLSFTYKIRQKQGGKNGTFPVTQTGSAITYKDYTGAKQTYKIPSANVEVKYLPPIITSVTPGKGVLVGGETVTIKGENFYLMLKSMY